MKITGQKHRVVVVLNMLTYFSGFCLAFSNYGIACCLWNQWQKSSWVKRGRFVQGVVAHNQWHASLSNCHIQHQEKDMDAFYYCMLASCLECDVTILHQDISHAILGRSKIFFISFLFFFPKIDVMISKVFPNLKNSTIKR